MDWSHVTGLIDGAELPLIAKPASRKIVAPVPGCCTPSAPTVLSYQLALFDVR